MATHLCEIGKLMLQRIFRKLESDAQDLMTQVKRCLAGERASYPAEPVVAKNECLPEPAESVGKAEDINGILGENELVPATALALARTQTFCGVNSQFSA